MTGKALLVGADGALYLIPDDDLRALRLDRAEIDRLIAGFRQNLGHTPEFAELTRALDAGEAETQAGGRQVALLIASLASISLSTPTIAEARPNPTPDVVGSADSTQGRTPRPDHGSLGEPMRIADRVLRVRHVGVTRQYRDGAGQLRTASPGSVFVRVRYQEQNLGPETLDTCSLRQLNFGGDQQATPLGHHFEETGVFVRRGESINVQTTFEVPLNTLGHNVMLYFVRPVDPSLGLDDVHVRALRDQGYAVSVMVTLPTETS